MSDSISFIVVYLFGGLTFLPLICAIVLLHAYLTFPIHPPRTSGSHENRSDSIHHPQDDGKNIKSKASASSIADKFHRRHEPDVAAGYFAVCREYVPGGINGKPPERTTPAGAVVAAESPSVYQSMYRSLFDRRQGPTLDPAKGNGKTVKRARNVFFVVLRHGHLMLYEDSEQLEVKHVISLELHNVSIYGGGDAIPEGELWIKRNAIQLARKPGVGDPSSTSKPFFLFSENCSDKEDFYFALLQNQDVRTGAEDNPPRPQQYETKHIINLVQKLHSSEEHLQTRWINGFVGRLFLALYKTRITEDFIRQKVTKKIARVKKPAFLSDIVLQKIDMGESAPHITNPRLKDLTIDGDCCAEADFEYNGNFKLEIAATARIDLGARFKAREVNLVLAVVVKKLNGHALVKFKPPPSNRIWITFESMPDMEMVIEPIVSSRQITYGIILRTIESRIREVMAETIVLPHWDDSPFTDTTSQIFRGGIWAEESTSVHHAPEHTKIPDEAPEDEAENEPELTSIPHTPPRAKDEKTLSMPVLSDASSPIPISKAATNLASTLAESSEDGHSNGVQKRSEPPKALRSRSFASAADPLLSIDNANVDSSQVKQRRKQKHDAAGAMMAISGRSRPTSPSDTPDVSISDPPTLWESSKYPSRSASVIPESKDHSEGNSHKFDSPDKPGQASMPPTPTSTSSRSSRSGINSDSSQLRALHSEAHPSVTSEKKQSMATLGAATAAAKSWGWGVLNRNANQKNQREQHQNRSATAPTQPMGRGRPLPPPGQPLPFPEGVRSKGSTVATPKRKPIAPMALPQRKHEGAKVSSEVPPALPARNRQSSVPLEATNNEGLLIVEAPPVSEPPSPEDEDRDGFDGSFGAKPEDISKGATIRDVEGASPAEDKDTVDKIT